MIVQAVDIGVMLDTGSNKPDSTLQRKGPDGWHYYRPGGKPMGEPEKLDDLPPGEYRLVDKPMKQ